MLNKLHITLIYRKLEASEQIDATIVDMHNSDTKFGIILENIGP